MTQAQSITVTLTIAEAEAVADAISRALSDFEESRDYIRNDYDPADWLELNRKMRRASRAGIRICNAVVEATRG